MPRYIICYKKPAYYQISVEAKDESEACDKAEELRAISGLHPFYVSDGNLEIYTIETQEGV